MEVGFHTHKMTSIIINSFYRALCSINDYTPIKDMDMKKLAVTLVDALYPEDGYVTLEDNPRGNFHVVPSHNPRGDMQCGVTWVKGSQEHPEEHATALGLGRPYMYALVQNTLDIAVAGMLHLWAGAPVGQKHHSRAAISMFGGVAARVCVEATSNIMGEAAELVAPLGLTRGR
jgi:hypothetical protein